jgi:hypothetical protein
LWACLNFCDDLASLWVLQYMEMLEPVESKFAASACILVVSKCMLVLGRFSCERETFVSVCGCEYLLAFLVLEVMLFLEASASYSGCFPVCFWRSLVWSSGAGVSEREKFVSVCEYVWILL